MVNTVQVNSNHWHDFSPVANEVTKLKNFTKCGNRDFSAFQFSLHLMLEQALNNVIVYVMISQNNIKK